MKKVEAIVRPEKVDDVRRALSTAGYAGLTVVEVEGHGKQKGITQQWRGETYQVELLPKAKLEIVVADRELAKLLEVLTRSAKTGAVGDGKIFVTEVQQALRIRTGEKGDDVL